MALTLPHGITATGINDEDLYNLLVNIVALVNEVKLDYTALRVDVGAVRTQTIALVADMASRISNHNTLATKLNADGGVTDTNYAAATAITAVDPAALTSTTIAAGDAVLTQG